MNWLLAIASVVVSTNFYGVAVCVLPDSVQQIKTLNSYGEACESEVSGIRTGEAIETLQKRSLSTFLYANEISEQGSVYTFSALNLLGLEHLRSELDGWGLVDIDWALNAQRGTVDATLRRCRGGYCNKAELSMFRNYPKVVSTTGLSRFFGEAANIGSPKAVLNRNLDETLVRSAIKKLALTDVF